MTRLAFLVATSVVFAQAPFAPFGVIVRNAAMGTSKEVAPGSFVSITTTAPELASLAGVTVTMRYQPGDPFRPLATFPAPNGVGIWALVPNDAPIGDFWVTLFRGDVTYTDFAIIRREAPALFTQSYSGFGPALALNYLGGTPTRNALTAAAVPGRTEALFATGLGNARAGEVTVDIAGESVPASFAGRQGTPGLDQINFVVPPSAYLGCYVPVNVRVRGVVSNTVTLSIHTDTFACAHPLGLSYSEMRTLDTGGSIPLANLSLSAIQTGGSLPSERVSFLLTLANSAQVALQAGVQMPDSVRLTCSPGTVQVGAVGFVLGGFPDIGLVTLQGPRGQVLEMQRPYLASAPSLPERFFTAGTWRLSAAEGPASFAFDQVFSLPPVIDSLNIPPFSAISSEDDLEVLWNGEAFGPEALVLVESSAGRCVVRASDGHVTLGKPTKTLAGEVHVSVLPNPAGRSLFSFALKDGRTVREFVSYAYVLTVPVGVR